MKLTIKLKLFIVDPKHEKLLEDTRRVFVDVLNYISPIVFKNKIWGYKSFQAKFYYDLKKSFPQLNAQQLIQAIKVVCQDYKDKSKRTSIHIFKKHNAIVYDARLLSYSKDKSIVSISTLEGRIKIPLHLNPYFVEKIKYIKGEADLVKKNNNWYLNQVIEVPEKEIVEHVKSLGIDMGVNNIAVDSLGAFYCKEENKNIELHRKRLLELKGILQKVNSKSSKRHLKNISGKESKFRKDVNIPNVPKGLRKNIEELLKLEPKLLGIDYQ